MNAIYYECHITIEPVFDERLDTFKEVAKSYGFRVADLLLKKRSSDNPERSSTDSFCTGRDKTYNHLESRMNGLVLSLKNSGFQVWRTKIEGVLFDQKFDH